MLSSALLCAILASCAAAQVTLDPSTICKGPTCVETDCFGNEIVASTETVTEVSTVLSASTETITELSTVLSVSTETITELSTVLSVSTETVTDLSTVLSVTTSYITEILTTTALCSTTATSPDPPRDCPTLTSTGTACRTCLFPGCTSRVQVTRSCGCPNALPTTTVNFDCNDPGACNRIGCTTVYDVVTAQGC